MIELRWMRKQYGIEGHSMTLQYRHVPTGIDDFTATEWKAVPIVEETNSKEE